MLIRVEQPEPWGCGAACVAMLTNSASAVARLVCITRGVENRQGNIELNADWSLNPNGWILQEIPTGIVRPTTPPGMQQVRAEVRDASLPFFEYSFERERDGWEPNLSDDYSIPVPLDLFEDNLTRREAAGDRRMQAWSLVTGLSPRSGTSFESDREALQLAAPESGSFVLVALRRRIRK